MKLFNELSNLRKENDEKNKTVSEKNTIIFTLQSKLTDLTTKIQTIKLKRRSGDKCDSSSQSQQSKDSPTKTHFSPLPLLDPKINIIKEKNKKDSTENLGFIDKHIIRPIRGGNINKLYTKSFNKFSILSLQEEVI